jgi:hypothetical protein
MHVWIGANHRTIVGMTRVINMVWLVSGVYRLIPVVLEEWNTVTMCFVINKGLYSLDGFKTQYSM